MRFDVHTVRSHLVNELLQAPQVEDVWQEECDFILLTLHTGEQLSVHLVERYMSVDEITYIFQQNTAQNYYTMLILWCDMFMPAHGQTYAPDDWMVTLLALFGDKIYAFDAYRGEPFIFPVHFTTIPNRRETLVRHGNSVNIGMIGTDTVRTELPYFSGFWRVARFDGYSAADRAEYWQQAEEDSPSRPYTPRTVRYYYNLLGISPEATRHAVKQAYRDLARKHHPDLNTDPTTTARMQVINDAYERVLRYLDRDA